MTSKNFKITIEYDGSAYHGWQRQKHDRTIQAELETAAARIVGHDVVVTGSGRTDAGVHALGQVANFRCKSRLNGTELLKALNSLLPDSIVIKTCREVAAGFHARYDAKSKTYRYRIFNHRLPAAVGRQYAWHIRQPLDREALHAASEMLIGRHDFRAFEGAGSPRTHSVRQIFAADWAEDATANYLAFEIRADGFLRFMVRNIVGTLVQVGRGKIDLGGFSAILHSRDRRLAGATAPPHGLFLVNVSYEAKDSENGG